MKTRPATVDKIKMLHLLFETYGGNIKLCAERENVSEKTLKKHLSDMEGIYEVQKDFMDMSTSLKERIYKDAQEIKDKKIEGLKEGHKTLKLAFTSLQNKLDKDISGDKKISAKEVAEIAKMVSEIIKNNEGVLEPEANNQATNPFNSVFGEVVNMQLNINNNAKENKPGQYKWNLPQPD